MSFFLLQKRPGWAFLRGLIGELAGLPMAEGLPLLWLVMVMQISDLAASAVSGKKTNEFLLIKWIPALKTAGMTAGGVGMLAPVVF